MARALHSISTLLRRLLKAGTAIGALAAGASAEAQRTSENALRSAEDAFGTSIGRESIGLYGPFSVRGFSPVAAGNVRLEELYFDAVAVPHARLIRGSTVRIGISAQGYPFLAPTGIADFRLRLPGEEALMSAVTGFNSEGSLYGEIDFQLPLGKTLGLAGGVGVSHDEPHMGGSAKHATAGAILRWRPTPDVEIIPFWGMMLHRDESSHPRIIMAGPFLPPKIERGQFLGQSWTEYSGEDVNYGIIGRASFGATTLSAGLFRSDTKGDPSFTDLFIGTSREGLATNHIIVAQPARTSGATSGEVRASREFREGGRRHVVHLSARGRKQSRRYGDGDLRDYGPARIGNPVSLAEFVPTFGALSSEDIRQASIGIAYSGQWRDVGELTFGIQKTDYRKEVTRPAGLEPVSKARPWLFNGALAIHASPTLAFYGGFTRGLEESGSAPDIAINRNEAPAALRTRQYDGGLRWSITPKVRFVGGFFNVEKPYFNLDNTRLYRRLGEVRHRGAELSLVGEVLPNLNLLIGAILLDAEVHGEAVRAGLVGAEPVGVPSRTLMFDGEYRIPSVPGLSVDLSVHGMGRIAANTGNSFFLKPAEYASVGTRYRWTVGKTPMSLRIQLANIFSTYRWNLQGSNSYGYTIPRTLNVRLSADF